MTVWRIKINSGRGDVDWDEAKAYCREQGLVGVGWGRPDVLYDGAPIDEVLDAIRAKTEPGWNPTGPATVSRLANQVADSDLMWTRDSLGRYWLCRITGPWRYDGSDLAWRWDLNNVRPCRWLERSFRDYDVPGPVVTSFTGVGQTLRRIGDYPAAIRATELLSMEARVRSQRPDPTI